MEDDDNCTYWPAFGQASGRSYLPRCPSDISDISFLRLLNTPTSTLNEIMELVIYLTQYQNYGDSWIQPPVDSLL